MFLLSEMCVLQVTARTREWEWTRHFTGWFKRVTRWAGLSLLQSRCRSTFAADSHIKVKNICFVALKHVCFFSVGLIPHTNCIFLILLASLLISIFAFYPQIPYKSEMKNELTSAGTISCCPVGATILWKDLHSGNWWKKLNCCCRKIQRMWVKKMKNWPFMSVFVFTHL